EDSRSRPLDRLITALGIMGVGEVTAGDLASHFPDLDALAAATSEQLQSIDRIGPNIAEAIVDWFQNPRNRQLLEKLRAAGVWPQAQNNDRRPVGDSLAGMTFVVTGTLPGFSREEAREFIQT